MALNNFDAYIGGAKQVLTLFKSASRTSVTGIRFSVTELAGSPGAGVLAGTSTTVGVVPVAGNTGFPAILSFGALKGYLTRVVFGCTTACRLYLGDLLWKGGAYAFNVNTTGNTPTSFASRVPDGTDYRGLEIWLEAVTAGTGVQNVQINYIDQDGNATVGTTQSVGAVTSIGRMYKYALNAGDTGVRGITGVVGTSATAGTFNLLVIRPLWSGRVRSVVDGDTHGIDLTGMPEIYDTSALFLTSATDGTATGVPELMIEVTAA